jgi:hypothetical protein
MNYDIGMSQNGKGTFIIKVEHCDKQTWQGEVLWADERKREKFRSALELLTLMNEAIKSAAMEQIDNVRKQG